MVTPISSRISDSISLLMNQPRLQRDRHFRPVKHGLRMLEIVFAISKNEHLNLHIQGVVDNALVELRSLSNKSKDEGSLVLKTLVETMKNAFINPETMECDVIFPKLAPDMEYFLGCSELLAKIQRINTWYIPKRIKDKLLLLQGLVTYVVNVGENIDVGGKDVFATLHDSVDKSAFIAYSSLDANIKDMENATHPNLYNLLEKNKVKEIYITVLRASNFRYFMTRIPLKSEIHLLIVLIQILKSDSNFREYLNASRTKLYEELNKLVYFLGDLPRQVTVQKLSYLVPSTEAIISGVIPIIYTSYDFHMSKKMSLYVDGSIQELSDQIKQIQASVFEDGVFEAEVFEMKLYNYPKIDDLGSLDLFLEHLEEILKCRPKLIENLKAQIETLHVVFDSLRIFLGKIKKQRTDNVELEDIWTRIIRLTYHAEYVIDLSLVKIVRGMSVTFFSFSNVIEQAKLIMSEVNVIQDEEKYHSQAHVVAKRSNSLPSTNATTNNVVVGFEDEAEKIMEFLLGDSKQLDVISIVGMPGLGKTTLAKKMYEETKAHFDIRAWCFVSQTYQKRELLISLLRDLILVNEEIKKLNDEELAAKVNKSLRGRRYLIVVDDLWNVDDWRDFQRIFPNDKSQSRILITTRLHDVASQVKDGSKVHRLRQFSDEESWELFQTIFKNESFSQEFVAVGKKISESCKGLPLAIVVATGLLAKSEKNIDSWERIAGSLSSHIFSDSENQCMAILELSYKELTDSLKSCFLYIGAFPEDAEIPVQKLKWLWIAEGFIRDSGEKSLDDIAEGYFMDLISRNLVTPSKERSHGGVKTCGIHDILRDFCLEKAKNESFFQVVDNGDGITAEYDQRRLWFYSLLNDNIQAGPSGLNVRSLFVSKLDEHEVPNICWNFRLLRVLDLLYVKNHHRFIKEVTFLIHLRYLGYFSAMNEIPSSISNLSDLQHLHIRKHEWNTGSVKVADSIWDVVNLRNVKIGNCLLDVDSSRFKNSNFTHNVETLSRPFFKSETDAREILTRLPKLRKLKCSFEYRWGEAHGYSKALSLAFLHQLLSLNVGFYTAGWPLIKGYRWRFDLPSTLQKLTLSSGTGQYWDEISGIGRSLPNLKVLKLKGTFEDETWIVNEEDFPKLKYLKFINSNIKIWDASEESFPSLEQLVLENCFRLEVIPPCFGVIATMQMIKVKSCRPSVDESVRSIEMEQREELQNEQFKASINTLR